MTHFSDSLHMDTCAGRFCNTLALRSEMKKVKGKRGYFCVLCFPKQKPKKT